MKVKDFFKKLFTAPTKKEQKYKMNELGPPVKRKPGEKLTPPDTTRNWSKQQ